MSVKKERVAECLLAAREKMNNRGRHWIKYVESGKNHKGETAYCSLGAIYAVTRKGPLREATVEALADSIDPDWGFDPDWGYATSPIVVTVFNDDENTAWGDVSRMFRKAAKAVLR